MARNNIFETKKNSFTKYILILIILLIVGAGGFIFVSPQFEQNKPNIL
jgi:hypothetical protein